jgi:hypothetical protein
LQQGEVLIRGLDEEQFTFASELVPGGTLGSHFRHCLDFYASFLRGLESGEVDYDCRDRTPEWETLPQRALDALGHVVQRLRRLQPDDLQRPLQVRGDGPPDEGWSGSRTSR